MTALAERVDPRPSALERRRTSVVYLLMVLVGVGAFLYPFWLPTDALLAEAQLLREHRDFAGSLAVLKAATARFPAGVFYAVHDDMGVAAFDWRDVAKALELPESCN